MEIIIKPESIDELVEGFANFVVSPDEEKNLEETRQKFVNYFNKNKIGSLAVDEYFQGKGKKTGCFTYELEWATRTLGGIGGGSVYKFGYEVDFDAIKTLLIDLLSFEDNVSSFYQQDGELVGNILKVVDQTKNIKGLKSGMSLTGKFLRMYYPNTFIQIFNHQEHFLKQLIQDYTPQYVGLELFLRNNYLLLKVKDKFLDKIPDSEQTKITNYQFMKLLYKIFPILPSEKDTPKKGEDEVIEALEVQHYQSLIHRNRKILFPQYKYYDEEYQNEHEGHFFAQEAGTIDFLFSDENNDFMVIELKRKSTDKTLGQILRYIGWVQENLAENNQKVFGTILAESKDIHLDFALKPVSQFITFRKINLSVSIE
jgi:hypothetical protein